MIPRLNISFSWKHRWAFGFGKEYIPVENEFLLNYARSGIVMALRSALPMGGNVGVVAYNCYTVANAIVEAGCKPVFVDVTEDLHIDLLHLKTLKMDAIIVTNLFGIHNDFNAIQTAQPKAVIIVDNAHGYGLPAEGDFTVYSINQGKFPAIGEGGILVVNNMLFQASIQQQYETLPTYSKFEEIILFLTMMLKAWMHVPWIYRLFTRRLKAYRGKVACSEGIELRKMANGVSRVYQHTLPMVEELIHVQRINGLSIVSTLIEKQLADKVWYGDNAFMVIARTKDPMRLTKFLAKKGVESATHFARAIEWAKDFGYIYGQCPIAEKLIKELIMIPTYKKYKI